MKREAVNIDFTGINDQTSSYLPAIDLTAIPLVCGYFKRGRVDAPMLITKANISSLLGRQNNNPYYAVVSSLLDSGAPYVRVLCIGQWGAKKKPNANICDGAGSKATVMFRLAEVPNFEPMPLDDDFRRI